MSRSSSFSSMSYGSPPSPSYALGNKDDNKEFTSKHSLDWKFLFLDHRYEVTMYHFMRSKIGNYRLAKDF